MAEFGKFNQLTFINLSVPPLNATNLNEMQRVLKNSDIELARSDDKTSKFYKEYYYNANCKEIENFQTTTGWVADASTSVSADTTNFLLGTMGVKYSESDNVGGWIGMSKTITALDLETFNDGSSSDVSDHILFWFYVSDITKFTYIQFKLGTNAANNYSWIYLASSLKTGWNCIYEKKENATTTGSPDWGNIVYVRSDAITVNNAINEYITLQLAIMYRADPYTNTYYTPFQKLLNGIYDYSEFNIIKDTIGLYYDPAIKDIGVMGLDTDGTAGNESALHMHCSIINFIAKFELYCKSAGESPSFTWKYDTNNYIEVYISSDTLYLYFYEAGVGSGLALALDNALLYNERYQIIFEKEGSTARVSLLKDGEAIKFLENDTTIDSTFEGCLYMGWQSTGCNGFMTNYEIGYKQIKLDSWDNSKIILKKEDQSLNSDDSLNNDPELWGYLPPNSIIEVELVLLVDGTNDGQDIKVNWVLTEAGQLSYKNCIGPGTTVTSISVAENMHIQSKSATSESNYGVVSAGWTYINEKALLYTGNSGGKVQIQWAQNTSSATAIVVKLGSYLKFTKIKV